MTIDEIKTLPLVYWGDWRKLTKHRLDTVDKEPMIFKSDLDDIVIVIFSIVCSRLEANYSELYPYLLDLNKEFFELEEKLFNGYTAVSANNPKLKRLKRKLKVPY